MEFWGVEVKAGEPFKVTPGEDMVLHLSQACLGEQKMVKSETVCLFVTVGGKKLVLGTLFTDKLPQQQFDLVFDNDFELSHNWKSGSVYFYGYKANNPYEDEEVPQGERDESESESESDSESEEDIPLTVADNGKPDPKAKKEKPAEIVKAKAAKGKEADAGKKTVKSVQPKKDDAESSDDLMSDDSEDGDDSDDSEDGTSESDEETPKKAEISKKRAPESSTKTPVQDKKAKITPQKTDGKKVSGHVATPYPTKGKTPGNKPQLATPKSGGSHACKSCNKTFGSDGALESHTKAKHSAK